MKSHQINIILNFSLTFLVVYKIGYDLIYLLQQEFDYVLQLLKTVS